MQDNEPQELKSFERVRQILWDLQKDITKALDAVKRIEEEEKRKYYQTIPGVEGEFDGEFLVDSSGKKHDVPNNYSAKSRLVHGDQLKRIEDNEGVVYKQIHKVDRDKIKGVLNKKEGQWYVLTDKGTFKISDTAAEFNHAEVNDEAVAIIPRDNHNVPFAALDRVFKPAGSPATAPIKIEKVEVKLSKPKS